MTLSVKAKSTRKQACPKPSDSPVPGRARQPVLIGYARVSTEEQNLALQHDALRDAGCRRIFKDQGISGSERRRPGLDKALATLSTGDTLVVWRLDRLGRSLVDLVCLIEELSRRGVSVRSLTESFDAASSGGRLTFHLMAAMAEFERSLIAERTRAGLAAARARGRQLGRPPRFSDLQRNAALKSVLSGRPVKLVARAYDMHPRTLYRMLAEARQWPAGG